MSNPIVKIDYFETTRYWHATDGAHGTKDINNICIRISQSDTVAVSAIPEDQFHFRMVNITGLGSVEGVNLDGYWLIQDWYNYPDATKRSFIYLAGEFQNNIRSQKPKGNATMEFTDWVIDGSHRKMAGGAKWNSKSEALGWLNQSAGKIDNIRSKADLVKTTYNNIQAAGGDISKIIKETTHINQWLTIYSDYSGYWNMAEAAWRSINMIQKDSQYADMCNEPVARAQLKDLFERLYTCEAKFVQIEKDLTDWKKITDFEKAWQLAKTFAEAPLRGLLEVFITQNVFRMGSVLYALRHFDPKRNPANKDNSISYENFRSIFYSNGGDRTRLDKWVEDNKSNYEKQFSNTSNFTGFSGDEVKSTIKSKKEIYNYADATNEPSNSLFVKDGKIHLQNGLGTAATAAVGGIIAATMTPATYSAAKPYLIGASAIYESTAVAVNLVGIPLGTTIKNTPDATKPTNNSNTTPKTSGGFKAGYVIIPLVLSGGILTYIFRKQIFKNK
jgi:hypothetical protein